MSRRESSRRQFDDDIGRLDRGHRDDAWLELQLIGRLTTHQRDDAMRPALHFDLRHYGVADDGRDDAGEPVARGGLRDHARRLALMTLAGDRPREPGQLGAVDRATPAVVDGADDLAGVDPAANGVVAHAEQSCRVSDPKRSHGSILGYIAAFTELVCLSLIASAENIGGGHNASKFADMARDRRPASTSDDVGETADERADELYSVPPEEFTTKREELVRAAKAAGDQAAARAIRALRKPSTSAWLANQLVRARRDDVTALVDLGSALRDAQGRLEGDALRELSRQRRKAVNGLVREARQLAVRLGRPVSDEIGRQLEEILEAALASPRAAAELQSGRLAAALERSGGFEAAEPPQHAARVGRVDRADRAAQRKSADDAEARQRREQAARQAARDASRSLTERISERDAAIAKISSLSQRIFDLNAELSDAEEQLRAARHDEQQAKHAVVQAEREVQKANLAVERAISHP